MEFRTPRISTRDEEIEGVSPGATIVYPRSCRKMIVGGHDLECQIVALGNELRSSSKAITREATTVRLANFWSANG